MNDCEAPSQCVYARLFDPVLDGTPPHPFLRGQTRPPQPLIPLFPGPGQVDLEPGRIFEIAVRVLGPFQRGEFETVLAAFEEVGRFEFGKEGGIVSFQGATMLGRREWLIATDRDDRGIERIRIVFETPAWLEH